MQMTRNGWSEEESLRNLIHAHPHQQQSSMPPPKFHWSPTSAPLVICPFIDFAVACVLLGMATYFLVSRMTQLCNSLASCCSPDHPQEQQQPVADDPARPCLACDRTGRNHHNVCTGCILQVLGQEAALINSDTIGSSVRSFLQKLQNNNGSSQRNLLVQEPSTCDCLQQTAEQQLVRTCDYSSKVSQEKEVIENLYYELEQERSCAAIAANESMAMITRLQEEKSLLLMEARQYQRIVEEQTFHDHKAITILKEMLLKREAEKMVLEEEIDIYRRSTRPAGNDKQDETTTTSTSGERRKSSSEDETSATIKAVEEERLSVLERVKRLEQQLQLLRGNDTTYNLQKKRTCDQGVAAAAAVHKASPKESSSATSSGIYKT